MSRRSEIGPGPTEPDGTGPLSPLALTRMSSTRSRSLLYSDRETDPFLAELDAEVDHLVAHGVEIALKLLCQRGIGGPRHRDVTAGVVQRVLQREDVLVPDGLRGRHRRHERQRHDPRSCHELHAADLLNDCQETSRPMATAWYRPRVCSPSCRRLTRPTSPAQTRSRPQRWSLRRTDDGRAGGRCMAGDGCRFSLSLSHPSHGPRGLERSGRFRRGDSGPSAPRNERWIHSMRIRSL